MLHTFDYNYKVIVSQTDFRAMERAILGVSINDKSEIRRFEDEPESLTYILVNPTCRKAEVVHCS